MARHSSGATKLISLAPPSVYPLTRRHPGCRARHPGCRGGCPRASTRLPRARLAAGGEPMAASCKRNLTQMMPQATSDASVWLEVHADDVQPDAQLQCEIVKV